MNPSPEDQEAISNSAISNSAISLHNQHFFYSEKQASHFRRINRTSTQNSRCKNCALIDGEEFVYTEMRSIDTPLGNWDDFKYLGQGDYSRRLGFW